MTLDVRWEDENGNEKTAVFSPLMSKLASIIAELANSDYPCLRWIDNYGDTTYNQMQLTQLADDLNRLRPRCPDDTTREHLEEILALVRKAAGETHTYVKFYGD